MHRHFLKILSQNPEYVKTFCKDMANPLKFGIRKLMIKQ